MKNRIIAALILAALMSICLFACSDSAVQPTEAPPVVTPSPEPAATPVPVRNDAVSVKKNEMQSEYRAPDGTIVLELHIILPEIENPGALPAIDIINDYYAGEMANHIVYAETTLFEMAERNYRDITEMGMEFNPLVSTQDFTVEYNKNGILSITRSYLDSWDGSNGDLIIKAQTFDTEKGGQIIADDLFSVPEDVYTEHVVNEILSQIKNDETMYYANYEELVHTCFQKDNFYLTGESVVYYYPAYSIAPGTAGIVKFAISYAALADILSI